jgi:hypothetical protein
VRAPPQDQRGESAPDHGGSDSHPGDENARRLEPRSAADLGARELSPGALAHASAPGIPRMKRKSASAPSRPAATRAASKGKPRSSRRRNGSSTLAALMAMASVTHAVSDLRLARETSRPKRPSAHRAAHDHLDRWPRVRNRNGTHHTVPDDRAQYRRRVDGGADTDSHHDACADDGTIERRGRPARHRQSEGHRLDGVSAADWRVATRRTTCGLSARGT